MTKSRYGLIAGIAGAAFAAWWFRRTDWVARQMSSTSHASRGDTIFSNSPIAD